MSNEFSQLHGVGVRSRGLRNFHQFTGHPFDHFFWLIQQLVAQGHVRIYQHVALKIVENACFTIELDAAIKNEFDTGAVGDIPIHCFFFVKDALIVFKVDSHHAICSFFLTFAFGDDAGTLSRRLQSPSGCGRDTNTLLSARATTATKFRRR